MEGSKILSMVCLENLQSGFDNCLSMSLKIMPKSFDPTCKNAYYPNSFNRANNLDYICPLPLPKAYGTDFLAGDERAQFSAWYEE